LEAAVGGEKVKVPKVQINIWGDEKMKGAPG